MKDDYWKEHYEICITESNDLVEYLGLALKSLERCSVMPGSTNGEHAKGLQPTRQRSIARTKLQEAIMWLRDDARELGEHPWAK